MQTKAQYHQHDVLVIGSGASGLSLALHLANNFRVAVLSKNTLTEGSTFYAQGGISAVLDNSDSIQSHINDTLEAGGGLCDEDVVRYTVSQGQESIEWLLKLNVPFTRDGDTEQLHLTKEGGHSHRRIAHAADATGQAIENSLVSNAKNHENIELFEHHMAIDLILDRKTKPAEKKCLGAYVLDTKANAVEVFEASYVILASGGASKVYLYTSNPDSSTGDGIAMAWRAGCKIANMEFMQFHPTCLYHPHAKSFLISEAVRGEGAHLTLNGERFMQHYDSRMELAPRDIVARAIDNEMKRRGVDNVFLDITHKSAEFIEDHFPNISAKCKQFGLDLSKDKIPVVPAAHYTCGGIQTDLNAKTDINNLYAVGEVTCTGLHGANRLASNSLLECLVFAKAAADNISARGRKKLKHTRIPEWDESKVTDADEHVVVSHNWDEIRRFMWDYVGIVRTDKRLLRAKHRVDLLNEEIQEFYAHFRVTPDLIELRNLALVADLIILSAISRKESRGLHYTRDYPETNPGLKNKYTILQKQ